MVKVSMAGIVIIRRREPNSMSASKDAKLEMRIGCRVKMMQ